MGPQPWTVGWQRGGLENAFIGDVTLTRADANLGALEVDTSYLQQLLVDVKAMRGRCESRVSTIKRGGNVYIINILIYFFYICIYIYI